MDKLIFVQMFKLLNKIAVTHFDEQLESKFRQELNQRARGMMLFIYWAGGLITLAFTIRAILLGDSGSDLVIRWTYLTFWATLTYFTFYAKRRLSFEESFSIYALVGTFYTSYIYIVISPSNENLTSSILLFLIGLLICQLRSSVMTKVAAAAVFMPILVMLAYGHVNAALLSNLLNILAWGICCWVASRILEKVNRRIFDYKTQLQITRDKEIKANEVKGRFLALMSHEIRTPLTSIIGHSDTSIIDTSSRQHMDQSLAIIHKNGKHLLALINDLLDISKMESGKLQYEMLEFSVPKLLNECVELIEVLAHDKGLAIESEIIWPLPKTIQSDPTRLKQVVLNLLNNAVKFTEKGKVKITTSFVDQQLKIAIEDTGIGMNEDEMKQLFRLFTQTDNSTTRKYGGSGLGLYLSKQIANDLGGLIHVTSQKHQGSCFTLYVTPEHAGQEVLFAEPKQEQSQTADHTEVLNGRVLVVDDFDDNRQFICDLLKHHGLEVEEASDGLIAVEKALINDYDLILMDIQMPVMGGEEALKLLHASGCGTPIIALTANTQESEQQSYLEQGFSDCLSKPIENDPFFKTISKYLGAELPQVTEFDSSGLKAKYVASLPKFYQELITAKNTDNLFELQSLSHKLKGSAAQFDLVSLGAAAAELEKQIPKQSVDDIEFSFNKLVKELEPFT